MTLYAALILTVLAVTAGSCKGGKPGVKIYHGVGVVVSVDRDAGTVQINHEDIKDFMTAMTMTFKVKRTSLLDNIAPGDKIEFTLRDDGSEVVIVKIDKRTVESLVLSPNSLFVAASNLNL